MFLVIVDAYSKYLKVVPRSHATSVTTISALRHVFSSLGLPEHIVTDNGSQFTSMEYQKILGDNDLHHTTTAPGHPATNGLAERYVGDYKDKLSKMGETGESSQTKLDTSVRKSPSELLMNRQPRYGLVHTEQAKASKKSRYSRTVLTTNRNTHKNKLYSYVILEREQNGYLA